MNNRDYILGTGKVPPQAVVEEEYILGALMVDSTHANVVFNILVPDDFYKEAHKFVYEAILSHFLTGKPINVISITTALKAAGRLELAGGAYALTMLTNSVVLVKMQELEHFAKTVKNAGLARKLISLSSETLQDAYDETLDINELLVTTTSNLIKLTDTGNRQKTEKASDIISRRYQESMKIRAGEILDNTILSHIHGFDSIAGGFSPSDLIILAARPGMGKTALALTLLLLMALHGIAVAIFSLEMSKVQLVNRLLSMLSGIPHDKIKRPTRMTEFEWETYSRTVDKFAELPIYIDDTPALHIIQFRAKANGLKQTRGIKMIFFDYIQLATGDKDNNREGEISSISRALKQTAKDLDVPVFALSQLNREAEKRSTRRPQLADLRESGAIEQDADMVIFIYRPAYYKIFNHDRYTEEEMKVYAEMIIEKHRNGETGFCELHWDEEIVYFQDFQTYLFRHTQIRNQDQELTF
jgi:replicative DNA helicase